MRMHTPLILASFAAALALAPQQATAVGDEAPPVSADHAAGKKAIEAKDWDAAIKALTAAAQRDSNSADVYNLLGYAYRNTGQIDVAFKHYQRALQIDPRHLGAHEYIGEAYLIANNPAKAEEHLASLKRFCPAICDEYGDLRKKIAEYRARAR